MVVLIGGESHVGKTLFAHRLMLRTGIPYTSLDHLKMGLIRAGKACFTALSPDEQIAREMWGIVKGMAETCLENRQDIILEGWYLLPEDVAPLQGPHTQALFLTFSDRYFASSAHLLRSMENVIERRKFPMLPQTPEQVRRTALRHAALRGRCEAAGVPCAEIASDYEKETEEALETLCERIGRGNRGKY